MNRLWVVAVLMGLCPAAQAYSVDGGNLIVRPVVGASVNALRLEAATRKSPPGGMLLGVDLDFSVNGPINITAAVRPVVFVGYVDVQLGLGGKYRVTQLGTPFIPYASVMATVAGASQIRWVTQPHANVGLRAALGLDYFVMKNLALGVEVGTEASALLYPMLYPEVTVEALAGVSYRFDLY